MCFPRAINLISSPGFQPIRRTMPAGIVFWFLLLSRVKPSVGRSSEARAEYDASEDLPTEGLTRLSSKNQITIPAGMVRLMGWKPGDEIRLIARGKHIALRRQLHGQELLDSLAGSWPAVG